MILADLVLGSTFKNKFGSYIGDENSEKNSVIRFLRKSSDSSANTITKKPTQNPKMISVLKTVLEHPTTILLATH